MDKPASDSAELDMIAVNDDARRAVRSEYQSRLAARLDTVAKLEQQESRVVNGRVGAFCIFLAAAFVVFGPMQWHWAVLAIPAAFFVVLVNKHKKVKSQIQFAQRSVSHYQQAIDRVNGKWVGVGPTGKKYSQSAHPYAGDLDIFGDGGLFQLMCGTRTRMGEDTLALWLLKPAEPAVIRERHEAIGELKDRIDLREQLATLDDSLQTSLHPEPLIQWALSPAMFSDKIRPIIAVIFGCMAGLAIGASLISDIGLWPLLMVVLLEGLLLLTMRKQLKSLSHDVDRALGQLNVLAQVLRIIEEQEFETPHLKAMHADLMGSGPRPSQQIAKLSRLVQRFEDGTRNQFIALFALLFMLFVHTVYAIDRWRVKIGHRIPEWLAIVGEIEALSSLARYTHEHPNDIFPEIVSDGPVVDCVQLGHPLINERDCVRNDIRLDNDLQLLLVSGSNMSGKSTLLRSLGVGVVMALAGAPIRAESMRVSPLAVGTSMRIKDSILDGESHFFAELKRLRLIVDLADGQPPLLFLLDEILHGTNSHDRRVGSDGIIRRLLQCKAIGLVTTHDLALSEIADGMSSHAKNVHFEDQLVDGKMSFDYRMRPGIVQKSNALSLMRSLGLDV